MNRNPRWTIIAAAAIGLGACSKIKAVNAPAVTSGGADFSVIAAIGTSVTSGFESGGLVEAHQLKAFPAAFARQVGATFTYPGISPDGFPALLRLVSLNGPVINNTGRVDGTELYRGQTAAFNNMGVTGSILYDVTNNSLYGRNPTFTGRFFDFVMRGRPGTVLSEALSLNPTFVTLEEGANEVLGPASIGSGTPATSPAQYAALLSGTMSALAPATSSRKVALFNVPNIASIPYFATISPRLDPAGNCHVLGQGGPLADGDLVLLTAGPLLATGTGVPVPCGGNGNPLPDTTYLLAAEAASIQSAIDAYNAAIDSVSLRDNVVKVDFRAVLEQAATTGIKIQGQVYTNAFVKGGLFGLDGIHPNDLGQGILCNALIDAVDAKFGSRIPHLNLADYATATSSRAGPADARGIPQITGSPDPFASLRRVPMRR